MKATRTQAQAHASAPTSTHTHTHTQKRVILNAFPQQQWFRECTSMFRYTYIACLVNKLNDLSSNNALSCSNCTLTKWSTTVNNMESIWKELLANFRNFPWTRTDVLWKATNNLNKDNCSPGGYCYIRAPVVAEWLRHCATSRRVSESIPSGVAGNIFRSYRRNHVPWGRLSL
jgi:hypothetical protein